jgi:hypothetical protein
MRSVSCASWCSDPFRAKGIVSAIHHRTDLSAANLIPDILISADIVQTTIGIMRKEAPEQSLVSVTSMAREHETGSPVGDRGKQRGEGVVSR